MMAMLFASNDHRELQKELNTWLRKHRPEIIDIQMVANGAEYTYVVLVMYQA
jgi:hypothetical protein